MEFKTPEKSIPLKHYELLLNAPKQLSKCRPKALFQSFDASLSTPNNFSSSSTKPFKLQFELEVEDCCCHQKLPPPTPPRKSLPTKFIENLLMAPKRMASLASINKKGRYSLPASMKYQQKVSVHSPNFYSGRV